MDLCFQKQPLSLGASKSVPGMHVAAVQQQYSSSGSAAAVLQALAFVPVDTVYVYGWRKAAGGDRTATFPVSRQ